MEGNSSRSGFVRRCLVTNVGWRVDRRWRTRCGGFAVVRSEITLGRVDIYRPRWYAIRVAAGKDQIISQHRKRSRAEKAVLDLARKEQLK